MTYQALERIIEPGNRIRRADVLSPEQLRRLGQVADRIMSRIDTSDIN